MSYDPHKVVLLGEADVGKTEIVIQYTLGYVPKNVPQTNQFIRKLINFKDGKEVTMDIWDTAGQEKYRSSVKSFLFDAKAIILVYDCTNEKSFKELKQYWYEQIKPVLKNNIILVVAGNKSHLYEEKKISNEEGEEWAKTIGASFFSTSTKNDSGIRPMFEYIGRKIIDSH